MGGRRARKVKMMKINMKGKLENIKGERGEENKKKE